MKFPADPNEMMTRAPGEFKFATRTRWKSSIEMRSSSRLGVDLEPLRFILSSSAATAPALSQSARASKASVLGAARGLRAEGTAEAGAFALYSSANPTYVNHRGPVGENIAKFP